MTNVVFNVEDNISEVVGDLDRVPALIEVAAAEALNEGMVAARMVAVEQAARNIGVPQTPIRQRMKTLPATRANLEAVTEFNPRGLNPRKLGYSAAAALQFYNGPRVGQPFDATMPNGSQQIAVRLPKSTTSRGRDKNNRLRRQRLPIGTIRIFIGKRTIGTFTKALEFEGIDTFEENFAELTQRFWTTGL